jgi:hypothetical protein
MHGPGRLRNLLAFKFSVFCRNAKLEMILRKPLQGREKKKFPLCCWIEEARIREKAYGTHKFMPFHVISDEKFGVLKRKRWHKGISLVKWTATTKTHISERASEALMNSTEIMKINLARQFNQCRLSETAKADFISITLPPAPAKRAAQRQTLTVKSELSHSPSMNETKSSDNHRGTREYLLNEFHNWIVAVERMQQLNWLWARCDFVV